MFLYLACPASISFFSSYLRGRPSINLLLGLIKLKVKFKDCDKVDFHLIPQYKYELFHIYFTLIKLLLLLLNSSVSINSEISGFVFKCFDLF